MHSLGGGAQSSGVDEPCVRQTFPPTGRQHIDKLSKSFRYSSFPPTSGPHYPPGPKARASERSRRRRLRTSTRRIFLTAWTHVTTCSTFSENAFTNFRDDFRGPTGDAPEKFPLASLQPGGQ
jgi:hypothetical protein